MAMEMETRRPVNHVQNICSTWGNKHFKTFDGDVFQFPGMCDYNLASNCHESYLEFSVHLRRVEIGGHPTINEVVIRIKDVDIMFRKTHVTVNDVVVQAPYYGSGVQLERNVDYTKLYAKLGLALAWNGDDSIMLELDSKYMNRTCGLCGDYNGIPVYNEFISDGDTLNPIQFGNLQKIHLPNDICEDPYEQEPSADCAQHQEACEQLLTAPAWSECTALLDPQPYVQACMQDVCSCGKTLDDFCVCSTLSEFSRQCSHAGGMPPNWRSSTFCAKHCPFNMEYKESGSPCMDTCSNMVTSTLCEEHRTDGCFCPQGTVFDDIGQTGCIPVQQCQCTRHGKRFSPGEAVSQDCEECVCHLGKWTCTSLPCPGSCSVEGGSLISTYDGKDFTFHGDCYYIISKDCVGNKFSVYGELVPCGSQEYDTCLKSVVVQLNNDHNNAWVFKADGKVYRSQVPVSLPYSAGTLHIFRPSSFHVILQTSVGLQLQVQVVPIMQLYVSLEQSYKSSTCGLCGDFNDNQSDDFKTLHGVVEGTAAPFANSWKAQSSCADTADRLDDPCALSVEKEKFADYWCAKLTSKDGEFAKCHQVVDPNDYFKKCKYSGCNSERSEDSLCAAFSAYVRACSIKGVTLQKWWSPVCDKYTLSCPASQIFTYRRHSCQQSCRSLGLKPQSCSLDLLLVDGCSCPEGLYQDDRGTCLPMAKCPCYHDGDPVKPGKLISIQDEHWYVHQLSLLHRAACQSPKTTFSCATAEPGSKGMECEKTCRNLAGSCYSVGCVSGCKCPDGLVEDGRGKCVHEDHCPCVHNGVYFAAGSRIKDKCNLCTCKRGTWECTKKQCPGTCTIYGSGNYITFDEHRFSFDGNCAYVATQDFCGNNTGRGTFSVVTENIPCGTLGTTCSKSVRVYLGRTELKLSDGKYDLVQRPAGAQVKYTVRTAGMYLVVESSTGLVVLWDKKTTIYIILNPAYKGRVCGLCGNYDHNAKNDFTTQGQIQVANPLEFGNSWKVSSSCPDQTTDPNPCFLRPFRHAWAKLKCSIIKGDAFKHCHHVVDHNLYYDTCVHDSCACDSGGDCECFCTAVAAYAAACNEHGVCVAWRTPEICPMFCDFYNAPGVDRTWHYSPCQHPCYKTCENPEGICNRTLPDLEGCYPECPPKNPIFNEHNNTCVTLEECGCFMKGTVYPPGGNVSTDQPCATCYNGYHETNINWISLLATCVEHNACTHCDHANHNDPYNPENDRSPDNDPYDPDNDPGDHQPNHHDPDNHHHHHHHHHHDPLLLCEIILNVTIGMKCSTVFCSDVCAVERDASNCSSSTPTTTPTSGCPKWNKNQNETFLIWNCTMVRCIKDNFIELIPYECPPVKNITCTSGRPPVLVYDENMCCYHYECDCYCNGWGDPHYVTFDGLYYSFQGNCTYTLVKEIVPKYDNFGVYIDNVHCDPRDQVSCPRSLSVSFETLIISLRNKDVAGAVDMEVLVNGHVVSLPFSRYGVRAFTSGINLVLQIPDIDVVVTFSGIAFGIKLPHELFGNNTEGQCGTCNNNQVDDCMLPGGQLVNDCAAMGEHWQVKDPTKPHCSIPPTMPTSSPPNPTPKPCHPDSVCELLKSNVFAPCHKYIPPEPFYQGCVFDSCHVENPGIECSSLQNYAKMCAQEICLDWRPSTAGKCFVNCPSDKVYKACGPAEQPTCEDYSSDANHTKLVLTEGCFCPEGTILFNKKSGICVEMCGCLDPEGTPREFGETFAYMCQNCICDIKTDGVVCEPKGCPPANTLNCTGPGLIVTNETSSADPCCTQLVCRCNPSTCPVVDTVCPVGFKPMFEVPDGKCCPEYKCVPKGVCVYKYTEYQPGTSLPVINCQRCLCTKDMDPAKGLNVIECVPLTCNKTCEQGFKYKESSSGVCCGKCVQTHCVVQVQDLVHLLQPGDIWSPPEDHCIVHGCVKIGGTLISTQAKIQCPSFHESNCQPGTIVTAPDGCCKSCVEKTCMLFTVKSHITHMGCKSENKIELNNCEGACSTYSMYKSEAGSMQHKCTCCREAKTTERTITLICPDGSTNPYTYIDVEECHCRATNCNEPIAAVLPL
ncbi:mucin-2 [Amia ocellicauda]|uniref:mucin-2 n=1 Tax=Amia ocellicauda TaxID=2972642 RepID=UPI003463AF5E